MLPIPTASFTLPSIYDGTELKCRIYFPRQRSRADDSPLEVHRLAIFAHPYAPLGGCYDDPVVQGVGIELLKASYILITFNFRGAEGSAGRTTWTGRAEIGDYVSVYVFAVIFLRTANVRECMQSDCNENTVLVLGGYSYGSMICMHLPDVGTILEIAHSSNNSLLRDQIRTSALELGAKFCGQFKNTTTTEVLCSGRPSQDHILEDDIEVVYLLVSPLIGAISSFATMFSKLSFRPPDSNASAVHVSPMEMLSSHGSLIIYGTEDQFASSKKTRAWCEQIRMGSGSRCVCSEMRGMGHFWHEKQQMRALLQTVRSWLTEL